MKCSVYNIIYRNDSTVKGMLEKDLLFLKTGFIAFRDQVGRFWFFHKKAGIIVPEHQEYLDRTYGRRDILPRVKKVRIGEDECESSFPTEEWARDFFIGLSKINTCAHWRVESRIWKILSPAETVYDAPVRLIRPEDYLDRVSILRCAYVKEGVTNRRNFTSFADWEYIDSYELASDGTVAIRSDSGQEEMSSEVSVQDSPAGLAQEDSRSLEKNQISPMEVFAEEETKRTAQEREGAFGEALAQRKISDAAQEQKSLQEASSQEIPQNMEAGQEKLSEEMPDGTQGQEKISGGMPEDVSEQESAVGKVSPQRVMPKEALAQDNIPTEGTAQALAQGNIPTEGTTQEQSQGNVSGEETGQELNQGNISEETSAQDETPNVTTKQETLSSGEVSLENSSGAASERKILSGETSSREDARKAAPESALSENVLSDAMAAESGKQKKKAATDIRELLDCDKRRCRLESYEENMLYDIKRGHWDLFDCEDIAEVPEKGKMIPRDPRKDIKTGVVGIDFGTKSTVVVRQDDTNAIIPIRIGAEVLSAELRENDYENPTIIECTNLDEFIKKYYEQEGRPETSCEDFFVSYDANNNYRTCSPNEFYAYYAELKQWANFEKDNVVVWDKQKHEYRFGAEGSESGKIINPIELYAYYIGMYINNMRNGIYMKYLMSFPVGYSKETRQLIVASFEKGIRKSLPQCVLEDEECMKDFSVQLGISEPAAYAVTALEMSDLEPKDENDQYRYGIFDFGGGTADFGFGIWRGASEEEYEVEGYDYVLECFGADSDVTLGGEKILELLAYAVFKKNKELARRNRITCSLPYGEQAFLGSEILISNSQIAQRNMSILKEELRPLWHQEENWEKKYRHERECVNNGEGGAGYEEYIEPSLYDMDGNKLSDCRFAVDTEELISLIKARIQKGIDAFFKCMSKAFQREDRLAGSDGQMHIFLAGNSSKSVFVRELFEKTIQEYASRFDVSCIKLMEALNGNGGDEYVPNAKTSVAYGLIKSREGSSIKVEKNFETDAEEQTRFKFYLGRERRRHFDCRLSPVETEYGSWIRFQGAAIRTVRIYYTTNPTADVREEPPVIDNIPYKEITIDPQKDAFVFIRACEPTAIEYAVAVSEEGIEEKEICKIDFGM